MADWFFVPAFIAWLAFEPNCLRTRLDYLELGHVLGPIQELLGGGIPYKDCYTLYGPLYLWLPMALMIVFGKTVSLLRIYYHIAWIVGAVVFYFVGTVFCKSRLIRYSIPIFYLLEVFTPYWSTLMVGFRMSLGFAVVGCFARYCQTSHRGNLIVAGMLSALALLYSTEIGLLCILLMVVLGVVRKNPVRDLMGFWLTFGATLFPFLLYLFYQDALRSYFETAFWITPTRHFQVWGQWGLPLFWIEFLRPPVLFGYLTSFSFKIYAPVVIYSFAAIWIFKLFRQRQMTAKWQGATLLVFYGFLQYLLSLRSIYGGQFQYVALPPLILLVAFLIEQTPSRNFSSKLLVLWFVYAIVTPKQHYTSLGAGFDYILHKTEYIPDVYPVRMDPEKLKRPEVERCGQIEVAVGQADQIEGVVKFIQSHTVPGEEVFTYPEHGIFNFLFDRPQVSRFYVAGLAWTTPQWRQEVLDEFERQQPRYVVASTRLSALAQSVGRSEELLPELTDKMIAWYQVEKKFGHLLILRRTKQENP